MTAQSVHTPIGVAEDWMELHEWDSEPGVAASEDRSLL